MGNSGNSGGCGHHTPDNEERAEWDIRMNTVLYCSPNGVVYETRAYSKADIDQLVQHHGLHKFDQQGSAVRLLVLPVDALDANAAPTRSQLNYS